MKQDNELQTLTEQFWQSFLKANDELNTFITSGMPSSTEKRHKSFVNKWVQMKEKAFKLCTHIDQLSEETIEPIEVILPWKTDTFKEAWELWKNYLAEQHKKYMKSRMEYAALNYLKTLSENNEAIAIEYLQFAMSNGYPRFFKVTNKSYEQPNIAGGRGDGDY